MAGLRKRGDILLSDQELLVALFFVSVFHVADLSWVFTLCQKLFSVLGIWWKSRKKRFLTSGNFDSRISKCCPSRGCFGSLVWKTWYIPTLWDTVEVPLFLFHLASLSSTMDNMIYSLFQHGSLCAENIPPERWLMPQITFCCVRSAHRKWWECRLTHLQVPSFYISSFLFFFFLFQVIYWFKSSATLKQETIMGLPWGRRPRWFEHTPLWRKATGHVWYLFPSWRGASSIGRRKMNAS